MTESNEWFSYIAGYTAGGAAFGVTWEKDTWQGCEYLRPEPEKTRLKKRVEVNPELPF